jgi:hypothetical protein
MMRLELLIRQRTAMEVKVGKMTAGRNCQVKIPTKLGDEGSQG